ncbi:MAG TPA: site-specific integrase [Gemmataceae bacterium]|nr:site-specific integrase [Gemmataceae bacterium]
MRPAHPWFRASKSAWYVELDGKQIRLGKHPTTAPPPKRSEKTGLWNPPPGILDEFHRRMAADRATLPVRGKLTVAQVCDLFLDYSHKHHAADTYQTYRHFLQKFCDAHGRLTAADVRPIHVTRWLDNHPSWKGGRRHAVMAVKRAYAWADVQGVLSPNPVKHIRPDPRGRRTRVLTKDEQAQILAAVKDQPFRDFVLALTETGCRPSEVARVTAAHFKADLGVWVLDEHKTSRITGRPRVVFLTPEMADLSRRLAEEFPEGPLFRGPRGKRPFTRNGIRCRFRRLRKTLPHLAHFVAYNYRHSYASRALVNQVPVAEVAALLGHVDTGMVSRVYGHLADQFGHLRVAARKAAG